jgi:NADH:ubiquinone reductase (H+-translocating)
MEQQDNVTGHRIVVVGAGYTGMMAAVRVAHRSRRRGGQVTLVNPSPRFTERLRMHQIATGQDLKEFSIATIIDGTGIEFVQGWASKIDPERHEVTVATDSGDIRLEYEYLIYAVGSAANTHTVPGADLHTHTLNNPRAATVFAQRLAELSPGGTVTVCGNGLTGIEAATEIAESRPDLRVVLLGRDEPGAMMGDKARSYLNGALLRLGVESRSGELITKVLPDAVELAGGELVQSDVCMWTTGFWASPLAAESGFCVDERGRVVVDAALRSVSHPSVIAIGDAAAIHQGWGDIHGTCQSGIPSAAHAADTIDRLLSGKKAKPFRFGYIHQPVSLGRLDAVIQFTKPDDTPRRWYLTGKRAVHYKEFVTSSPPTTYRLSRRLNLPKAFLSAKGGRSTRRAPADLTAVNRPTA